MMRRITPAEAVATSKRSSRTRLEDMLVSQIAAYGLPVPRREFRFHQVRRWRFDLAWPEQMLAVEVDGGTWTGGRHTRPQGYERDTEKFNSAALAGWRVMHFTSQGVRSGEAIRRLAEIFGGTRP